MRMELRLLLLGAAVAGITAAHPTAAFAQQETDAAAARPTSEGVWVHLGDDGARLEVEEDSAHDEWTTVCSAPCDLQVSDDFYYRLSGGGHMTSPKFTLRGSSGDSVRLEEHGGSVPLMVLGLVGIGVGAAALLVAVDNIVLGPLAGPAYSASIYGPNSSLPDEEKGGLLLLAVGLPTLLAGYFALRASRTITVSQELTPAPTSPRAWQRSRDAEESAWTRSTAPLFSVSLLKGAF